MRYKIPSWNDQKIIKKFLLVPRYSYVQKEWRWLEKTTIQYRYNDMNFIFRWEILKFIDEKDNKGEL